MSAMEIQSPANPRIRAAAALRERREREQSGLTLVDGARESLRAIEAGIVVETAFVCPALVTAADARLVLAALNARAVELVEVSQRAFAKVAYGDRADGIVLVMRAPTTDLAAVGLGDDHAPFVVVTEALEKPGNLGAILRSADGAGVDAVISAGGTDLFNPNVIRASIGTVFSMPIASAPAEEVLAWLRAKGLRIVAARVDADRIHSAADLSGPLAIVLGSEARGLSTVWEAPDIEALRLPMLGVADSLNVSVAAAVLLYEARRQRDR
jgi:RNA methyltransferase, TrmH family